VSLLFFAALSSRSSCTTSNLIPGVRLISSEEPPGGEEYCH
jgi:hypothetical protein